MQVTFRADSRVLPHKTAASQRKLCVQGVGAQRVRGSVTARPRNGSQVLGVGRRDCSRVERHIVLTNALTGYFLRSDRSGSRLSTRTFSRLPPS